MLGILIINLCIVMIRSLIHIELDSRPAVSQFSTRSRIESSPIDFSQSLTQMLASVGNLNENPREVFALVSACTDNWRQTIGSRYNS